MNGFVKVLLSNVLIGSLAMTAATSVSAAEDSIADNTNQYWR